MGKSRTGASTKGTGKRSRSKNGTDPSVAPADPSAKKLLANNRYAVLENGAEPTVLKKEKVPPFFVKGFPEGLREAIYYYIEKGLKCTIRMCTEGYKLMVPAMNHYKAVQALLEQRNLEYFSHDIEAEKPLKVVLRGLPDMDAEALSTELKDKGLKPVGIHKMRRHNTTRKYRDQLYLVHLEKNSTCLSDLQTIRALFHIVVSWERYKPVHRDVTQCTRCLLFGHGTKNCRMTPRCVRCGKAHDPNACELLEAADPICANCGAAHKATSKACPKRAEFIEIRKRASVNNQPGRRRAPEVNQRNFPAIRNPITLLPPLPLNSRRSASAAAQPPAHEALPSQHSIAEASASCSYTTPPGLSRSTSAPGLSFAQVAAGSTEDDSPLSTEEFVTLVAECIIARRTCRTRSEQLQAAVAIITKYGP